MLIHSLNVFENGPKGWASLKPGVEILHHLLLLFQVHDQGSGQEGEHPRLRPVTQAVP